MTNTIRNKDLINLKSYDKDIIGNFWMTHEINVIFIEYM